MSEHQSLDALIEQWLDGTASEPELRHLEERLRDPQQRQRFVAACRLHATLETMFQEEAAVGSAEVVLQTIAPAPRTTRRPARLRWAAAAALMLTAAAMLWSALGRVPTASTSQAAASGTAHRPPTEINVARIDSISTQEAVFFFGLVTSNAIK